MKSAIFAMATLTVAVSAVSAAQIVDPLKSCRPVLSREEFESRGGKIIMTAEPDMRSFPKDIAKICRGAAGLGVIVYEDGSIIADDFEHNYFSAKGDTFETSGNTTAKCDHMMEVRVKKMRFAPPRLNGKSVCVRFYVDWTSSEPNKLSPFGIFPR